MAIYRGTGGAGDATGGISINEVTEQATNAAASATAAANSATAAATSASSAATSASSSDSSATAAATSASNAANSASAASTSETNAAASETAAADSETNAAASEAAASTSETNAAASASAASTSATNAAASAAAASTSETNAAASESAAATSASNASTSATAASNAQTAAEAAQAAAEAAQEAIDGLYLGAQTSDPSVDLNGDPVTAGDWYYNTATAVTRIYDGSAWNNGAVNADDFLKVSNNLSDLNSASTARTNLGLGTAATTASTDYATAAQGTLADSATQPGDNVSSLTNDAGYATTAATVAKTSSTGSAVVPTGTQAQRDGSPSAGYFRFNSDTSSFEGYNGSAWGSVGGGATGGGNDAVFIENDQTVTTNYTIPSGKNAMSTGVVTINSGVTVTVSTGSRYVVI